VVGTCCREVIIAIAVSAKAMAVDNSELEARTWNPSTISGLLRAVPEENGASQRAERIRWEFPFQILRRDPGLLSP
jgi:hypothetical protein